MLKTALRLPLRLFAGGARYIARRWFREFSGWSVSLIVHVGLLLVLALVVVWHEERQRRVAITVLPPVEFIESPTLLAAPDAVYVEKPEPQDAAAVGPTAPAQIPGASDIPAPLPSPLPLPAAQPTATVSREPTLRELMLPVADAWGGGGFEGRSKVARTRLVGQRGGTPASEDAVARGLAWLAAHQRDDGSWRFDHRDGLCGGLCGDPGTAGSTTAATGLALLPFLGAGETTADSEYHDVVQRGLYYLSSRLLVTPQGGDLQEGTMYAQGIATIALCEAYAMTGDEALRSVAQQAIDFICHAQHAEGGWRYFPGQPGDTTVYGWQLMALKSAQLARLHVPRDVVYRAERFLDVVQSGDGAFYGYQTPDKLPTPTAVGLLSRMYFGWPQKDPRLAAGVAYLEKLKPSRTDVYFNYYATQVLHHHEGPGWNAWNTELRDRLIATQSRRGHEHGSWYFEDKHGKEGGRLYTTAMCLMILEVYYRHMPLYGQRAVEEDF